jgi:hypothetical protein
MARQAKNNVNKFKGLEDSPAIQGIEKIYEANEEARQKRVAEALEKQQGEQATIESEQQPQVTAPASAAPAPAAPSAPSTPSVAPAAPAPAAPVSEPASMRKTGKKTQNGITIYVPMEYYMQILQMKMETGTPIKDIALQAVIEYLDRHKND